MGGEVLVGPDRRRRWSAAEKSALIAESLRPGACVSEIARRRGISRALLYGWRRQALGCAILAAQDEAPGFVPVLLTAPPPVARSGSTEPGPAPHEPLPGCRNAEIEVTLPGGARVILRGQVEMTALRVVLAALRP